MKKSLFFLPFISAFAVAQPPPPPPGGFSLNIDNEFLPYAVGMVNVLRDPTIEVRVSVLDQTELVAGVTTRVIEEYELENGQLIEISRNFYAQHDDGTVWYFGEDVDIYQNGQIVGHGGAWRAGEGQNQPGIMMPAQPAVGQTYTMEYAPGIVIETAEIVSVGETYVTPAGTFDNVVTVLENGVSIKKYAPGVGMVYDDGIILESYSGVSDVEEVGDIPLDFTLAQNYPNPFNPSTVIRYAIPRQGSVALKVYDMTGREVATLVSENKSAGEYEVHFDIGAETGGQDLAAGVYLYRLTAGDFSQTKKLLLLK